MYLDRKKNMLSSKAKQTTFNVIIRLFIYIVLLKNDN